MTSGHDKMTELARRQLGTAPDDPAVTAARATVQLARQRVDHVRRAFMRREVGRADVATAEAALSVALDQLDHVPRNHGMESLMPTRERSSSTLRTTNNEPPAKDNIHSGATNDYITSAPKNNNRAAVTQRHRGAGSRRATADHLPASRRADIVCTACENRGVARDNYPNNRPTRR